MAMVQFTPLLVNTGNRLVNFLQKFGKQWELESLVRYERTVPNRIYFDTQYLARHCVTCATPGTINPSVLVHVDLGLADLYVNFGAYLI